jgi:hypothetical protein
VPVVRAATREKEKQEKLLTAFERQGSLDAGTKAPRKKEKKEKLVTALEREGSLDAHIGAPPPDVKKKSTHDHYTWFDYRQRANNEIESFWRLKKKEDENEKAVPTVPAKFLEEERPTTAVDLEEKVGKESRKEELELKTSECISTCRSGRSY